MNELYIAFTEAHEAHIARGYTMYPIGISFGDLEAIARQFNMNVHETVKLFADWRKAKVAK